MHRVSSNKIRRPCWLSIWLLVVLSVISACNVADPQASEVVASGIYAYNSEEYHQAAKLLTGPAAGGDPQAQCYMGKIYRHGRIGQQDFIQAQRYFQRAADYGLPSAMNSLGVFNQLGLVGSAVDFETSVLSFKFEVQQSGDFRGMKNLAAMYRNGLGGLAEDQQQARSWIEQARISETVYRASNPVPPPPGTPAPVRQIPSTEPLSLQQRHPELAAALALDPVLVWTALYDPEAFAAIKQAQKDKY